MIAYNSSWLTNLYTREQAEKAFQQGCLDKEELEAINSGYPVHFYTPNFFIRIGLFILTTVTLLFSFGLFGLLFLDSIDHTIGGLAIFFGLLSYAMLEFMVHTKKHFQSGADDALLWISSCSLFGGTSFLTNAGDTANCIIIFIISCYYSLRFADRVMSAVCYISLLAIIFFAFAKSGTAARVFVPFAVMGLSAIIYLLIRRTKQVGINHLYSGCLQVISISALFSFYFSGNYYIVREFGNAMFNLNTPGSGAMPAGWLFWIFTLVTPCLYIIAGIRKKDIVLIRVGLVLIAAVILTVRYYYSVAPVEVIMTAGGISLVAVSYGLTRYLKAPRFGFINEEIVSAGTQEKLQVESILLAQTFTSQPASAGDTRFGGGSFGGGGASSEF